MAVAKVGDIEIVHDDSTSPDEDIVESDFKPIDLDLTKLRVSNDYVKVNVGGALFQTTLGTLTNRDGMLRAMFSGRMEIHKDEEGWVMIDRSGKHFPTILSYLRDGNVPLPDSRVCCEELLMEARYYLLEDLVTSIERHMIKITREEYLPRCRVPVITSPEEEQRIVSTSSKPLIKLLCNRSNNKYSYTSQSDDNLLKNLELFDKLAVRFAGRVKFVKDIVGRGEICQWSFYGHGKKVAEISCESIVYATEKKHTKIEFPEARILEEALNIMLYERPFENVDRIRAARVEAASRRRHFEDFLSDLEDDIPGSPPPPPPPARH